MGLILTPLQRKVTTGVAGDFCAVLVLLLGVKFWAFLLCQVFRYEHPLRMNFIGSDVGDILMTILHTVKENGPEPVQYLAHCLRTLHKPNSAMFVSPTETSGAHHSTTG